jgi:hypothetical protein
MSVAIVKMAVAIVNDTRICPMGGEDTMIVDTAFATSRFSRQGKMALALPSMTTAAFVAVLLAPIGTASAQQVEGLRFRADVSAAQVVPG